MLRMPLAQPVASKSPLGLKARAVMGNKCPLIWHSCLFPAGGHALLWKQMGANGFSFHNMAQVSISFG